MKSVRYSYGITSALLASGAALTLMTGFPAGAQVAQNDRLQMENIAPVAGAPASFADLTEALQPAVVNISTTQTITVQNTNPFAQFFGNRGSNGPTTREAQSLGSGFLVSADGYVVTNNHVVAPDQRAELKEVIVTLSDGQRYEAELVGTDSNTDLAVLKISRPAPFPFVRFGDSSQARVGDWVIAIGNPFNLGSTVTSGIISAVYRNVPGSTAFNRFIQTDASINRGNSGGPLFDMQGNVIGVNNAIISPTGGNVGIGFAIPAETASPIVMALIDGEEIERGFLGIGFSQIADPDMSEALDLPVGVGVTVTEVREGQAAERAGLQIGDVITEIDGETINLENPLQVMVANLPPGQKIRAEILRNGERRMIDITLGKRPPEDELQAENEEPFDPEAEPEVEPSTEDFIGETLGVRLGVVDAAMARRLGVPADTGGLWVEAIDRNSDAASTLSRGSIILRAGSRELNSVADMEEVLREARAANREVIRLQVRIRDPRGSRYSPPLFVAVRLK